MSKVWLSADQIHRSLDELRTLHPFFGMAFLAFKFRQIPIGDVERIGFAKLMREFLSEYYKPSKNYSGYYNPFRTSDPSNRWITEKYPSGALQRITVDTFGQAIIHDKNEPFWGWKEDYVDALTTLLRQTKSSKVPAFHLAVWLFRNEKIPDSITPRMLIERFLETFHISVDEYSLFDLDDPAYSAFVEDWVVEDRVSEEDLLNIIGWPPGEMEGGAVELDFLEFWNVGPAQHLRYAASSRLNIVTGDNSLGKTFLLECIWWAITGNWGKHPAAPRLDVKKPSGPRLAFSLNTFERVSAKFEFGYDWKSQSWASKREVSRPGGLAIYARFDGSHVVWDTTRPPIDGYGELEGGQIFLSREELWDGKEVQDRHGRKTHICNGLIRDWMNWQTSGERFEEIYSAFVRSLEILSPSESEKLVPDEPTRMPNDAREIPTLRMKYGSVPILHASAGVQRIVGLAYLIVWTWFEHKRSASLSRRDPQDRMVLIIDEVEAHLHPKWQRAIVPAIINVIEDISVDLEVQVHLATHSPLILASAEPIFDSDVDSLHHLSLAGNSVTIEWVEFRKHGSVDAWLTSDIFGLRHARSVEAERAIESAKKLQLSNIPDTLDVRQTNEELVRYLRDDDEFWPRWRYFAEKHLIEE